MSKLELPTMMQETFSSIRFVEWVVWYANTLGSDLTPIRIVKFSYLLDLYSARKNRRTLSEWQWKFVHYGPFCGEAFDTISRAESMGLIEGRPFTSKFDKDTRFYKHAAADDPEGFPEILDVYVASEIKHAVKLWSDDTYGLLNHVYFETEPMSGARPGEVLDFSCAEMPVKEHPIAMIPLSKKKVNHARKLIQELRSSRDEGIKTIVELTARGNHDDLYFRALESLDDCKDLPPFGGTLLLKS